MIGVIAMKEVRNNFLEFRFQVTVALFLLLVISSTAMMSLNYKKQNDTYQALSKTHLSNVENMTSGEEFTIFGLTQEVPPSPLSVLAIGTEPDRTRALTYSELSEVMGTQVGANRYNNPVFSLFPPPDFVYVVNIVLSLLALLFAFDAVSGEKEDQTLKLMMTNPVSKANVLLGKFLGGLVCLAGPFTVAFLLAVLTGAMMSRVNLFTGDLPVRLFMLYLTALLYIAVFFSIGLLISTSSGQRGTTLMISLFVWVAMVLAVPNIAPILAAKQVSVPSSGKMQLMRMAIEQEEQEEYAKNLDRQPRREPGEGGGLGGDDEVQKRISEKFGAMVEIKRNKIREQISKTRFFSLLSPSAAYMFLATNMAGTGVQDYLHLRAQAQLYRDGYKDMAKEAKIDMGKKETIPERYQGRTPLPPVDTEKLKPFLPTAMSLKDSLNNSAMEIGVLAGYLILSFILAFVQFMRYDVK